MNEHLGAAIKEARDYRGFEQQELATLLGVSESTMSKLEHGKRTLNATEFLTLGLIFPEWFRMRIDELLCDLKADLATRFRQFLEEARFGPLEFRKRDWLQERLSSLDGEPTIIA